MGNITKAEVLKALKEYQFAEKDKAKRAELIDAIQNATEDSVELIEHKATLQVAHANMDITFEGSRTSSGDISITSTTTYNHEITSGRHVWLVEGDASVAEMSELRNGLSPDRRSTLTLDMRSMFRDQYAYRKGNEPYALSLCAINYAKDYVSKLNLSYSSARVNTYEIELDSDPYELSYWDVYFTYTTAKGKKKRINVGKVFQQDLSEENDIELMFPFEDPARAARKRKAIIYSIIGVVFLVLFVIYMLFIR